MNLLKKVIINGEVGVMYASVSFQYIFSNSGEDVSPRFFIPVPENACITGFNFLDNEKRLIRGEVGAKTETETDCTVRLCMDEYGICCFSWDEEQNIEEYVFSVDMIIRLIPSLGNTRLHIPLGIHTPAVSPVAYNACPFELTLYARPDTVTGTSVTHSVKTVKFNNETMFSINGSMGKDLIIDFNIPEKSSCGAVGEYMGKGIGVYRIFSQDRKMYVREKENIILLLDLADNISDRKCKAVKELLFKTLQKIPERFPVQILTADEENLQLLTDFTECDAVIYDEVFEKLSHVSHSENNFERMLKTAEKIRSDKTEIILISGGDARNINNFISKSRIKRANIFTIGDFADTNFTKLWKRKFSGIHEHFYMQDVTESRILQAVRRVIESGNDIEVTTASAAVDELVVLSGVDIAADGYIDVVVSYTGRKPRDFSIIQNGKVAESCTVSEQILYQTLPEAEKILAREKTECLYRLLQCTAPVSIKAIKKQLEIVGTQSGILNSETVIMVKGENKKNALTVDMYSVQSNGMEELADRPTMFGQNDFELYLKERERREVISFCKALLLNNIRKDGSVSDRFCRDDRVSDSVYAVAAFILMNEEELSPVIEDIKMYINGKHIGGFAEILYNNLDNLKMFLKTNRDTVFNDFPSFKELAERKDVESAARIMLRISI